MNSSICSIHQANFLLSRNTFAHFAVQHAKLLELGLSTVPLTWHVIDHDSSADRRFSQSRFPSFGTTKEVHTIRMPLTHRSDKIPMGYSDWVFPNCWRQIESDILGYFDGNSQSVCDLSGLLGNALTKNELRDKIRYALKSFIPDSTCSPVEFNCGVVRFLAREWFARELELSYSSHFYAGALPSLVSLIYDLRKAPEAHLSAGEGAKQSINLWILDSASRSRRLLRADEIDTFYLDLASGETVQCSVPPIRFEGTIGSNEVLVPSIVGDCVVDFSIRPFAEYTQYWRCRDVVGIAGDIAKIVGSNPRPTYYVGEPGGYSSDRISPRLMPNEKLRRQFEDGVFSELFFWIIGASWKLLTR
ncbi:MAG: hypothetical protein WDN08_14885 [Rhizomicrobium sp.]